LKYYGSVLIENHTIGTAEICVSGIHLDVRKASTA
jgi:hypothetical protein